MREPWRIFLLDDHPLVRMWLGQLIEQQPDLSVCGEAETSAAALNGIAATSPDLALIDISLPDSSGVELIKVLKKGQPRTRLLVFSMHEERLYAERVIRAGASGYVMKRATADGLIEAIYRVLRGRLAVSSAMERVFSDKFGEGEIPPPGPTIEVLSDRELEIFQLIGTGADTRSISKRLQISVKTVQAHCANIKLKLDLGNATEILREAFRWNEFH